MDIDRNWKERDNKTGKSYKLEGYVKDLMDLLAQDLHFPYEFHLNTKYGSLDQSGNWSGMIGRLINRVSKVVHCCPYIRSKRFLIIYYYFCLEFAKKAFVPFP